MPCASPWAAKPPVDLGSTGDDRGRNPRVVFYARSKRSRFMTFVHAATKSCRNFSGESVQA